MRAPQTPVDVPKSPLGTVASLRRSQLNLDSIATTAESCTTTARPEASTQGAEQGTARPMSSAEYPEDVVAAAYASGDVHAVARQLTYVSRHFPSRTREFIWDAARAVAVRYCTHGVGEDQCPPALPEFSAQEAAVEAARLHPGLCGYHHASTIAGVNASKVAECRGSATAKGLRNQVTRTICKLLVLPESPVPQPAHACYGR